MSTAEQPSPPSGKNNRLFLQSVARTLRVLEAFSQQPRPLSIAELSAAAGLDKSAGQRIAHTLQALGYLERSSAGLVPGKKVLYRAFDFLRMNALVESATPVLHELRKSVKERIDLSLLDGTDIVYVVRLQSKRETFSATLVGRRIPAFCASGGRAMLAALPEAEAMAILEQSDRRPLTPKTITDMSALVAKIEEARRDGYALALEESALGEIVLSAAVLDIHGRPVAAIHAAGSLSEWTEETFRRRVSPLVMEAARALSHTYKQG
ncbi:transcriptional regulator, IclR family protein [Acetobacteraceae bacterium AT-5844]|nr:transcriptional regulator, IclR family protein [Acetobacteraceae bacterium AT-5844]